MKRIEILYAGVEYTVADRNLEDLKTQISDAVASGKPSWLRVNRGEGTVRPADLLVTSATHISVVAIHEE